MNFNIHFSLAHKRIRESKSSARTVGFDAANFLMVETAPQLANLETNTANSCTTINKLTKANQCITTDATTTNATLVSAVADIAAPRVQLMKLMGTG